MGKYLKFCALLLGSVLVFGCASQQTGSSSGEQTRVGHSRSVQEAALEENDSNASQKLVSKAHSAIGTPYVLGGSKPGGFDCSGLVKWAYKSVGVDLPRTAREQSVVGKKIKNVSDMRAGDIVAFRHPKRGYHTGIYVGDGKFIHSPRKRTTVRINSLSDPYFSSTLLGARRVKLDAGEDFIAQAESRLDEYVAQRHNMLASSSKTTANTVKKTVKSTPKSVSRTSKKRATTVAAKTAKKAATSKTSAKAPKSAKSSKVTAKNTKAKTQTKSVASNGRKAVTASKASSTKKAAHKTVSMLHKKSSKTVAKSRKHS